MDTRDAHELRRQYDYAAKDKGEAPSQEGFLNYARENAGDMSTSVLAASEQYRRRPRR